jgi:hypothetical protein
MLILTSGKSNVELRATTAAVVPEVNLLKDSTEFKMTSEFWQFLNEKLPLLKLEKVHSAQTDPRLFYKCPFFLLRHNNCKNNNHAYHGYRKHYPDHLIRLLPSSSSICQISCSP